MKLPISLITCLFFYTQDGFAQSSETSKGATLNAEVYLIDMQKVIDASISGKAARNNLEQEVKKSEQRLAVLRADADKMRDDLSKQVSLLSAEALEERKQLLAKRERELRRAIEDQKENIERKREQEIGGVVRSIDAVINELSAAGTYSLIMERDPRYVMYVNPKFDITEEVIKKLDQKQL